MRLAGGGRILLQPSLDQVEGLGIDDGLVLTGIEFAADLHPP